MHRTSIKLFFKSQICTTYILIKIFISHLYDRIDTRKLFNILIFLGIFMINIKNCLCRSRNVLFLNNSEFSLNFIQQMLHLGYLRWAMCSNGKPSNHKVGQFSTSPQVRSTAIFTCKDKISDQCHWIPFS